MDRRDFLVAGSAVALAEMLGPRLWADLNEQMKDSGEPLPRRTLGRTGAELSVVGLGGLSLMGLTPDECARLVAGAMDRGLNYFDVAPTYARGEAERLMGHALKGRREGAFLACKTQKRDKAGARAELEASLAALGVDHFDLYQMHAIMDVENDVDRALAPGGALEAFVEAREQGLVRFLGFSSHSVEAAVKAAESGNFDTILHPVNFVCHHRNGFDRPPLEAAAKQGMGRLALKAMARTTWPKGTKRDERPYRYCWYQPTDEPELAALALRWTLGRGVTAALPPGHPSLFRMAMNVASKDKPLEPAEEKALAAVAEASDPLFPRPPRRRPRSPARADR